MFVKIQTLMSFFRNTIFYEVILILSLVSDPMASHSIFSESPEFENLDFVFRLVTSLDIKELIKRGLLS